MKSFTETIAALGRAVREPWAQCRSVHPKQNLSTCVRARGHTDTHSDGVHRSWAQGLTDDRTIPAKLEEWKAEWESSGGDPKDGPQSSWTNGEDEWSVWENEVGVFVNIIVGKAHARRSADGKWRLIADEVGDAEECLRLMKAVDEK